MPRDPEGGLKQLRSSIWNGTVWEDVSNFIVRPDRHIYDLSDLGPPVFRISDHSEALFQRIDMELENPRGMKLQCSWYRPMKPDEEMPPQPCLVYLHGNCGSRYDGLELLHILRHGISLFTYDASGSGKSDGDFVTLGFYERQDLAAVVDFLHGCKKVTAIGLWGRSMGGVTSIMYASKDKSIKCVVADSPFSNLRVLCSDLVQQHASWVPTMVESAAVGKVRKAITKRAFFDINDLDTVKYAEKCECPAFMFHGADDDFVLPYHSERVADAYGGSCLYRVVSGGHNSTRGGDVQSVAIPLLKMCLIDKPEAERERQLAAGDPQSPGIMSADDPSSPMHMARKQRDGKEPGEWDGNGQEDDAQQSASRDAVDFTPLPSAETSPTVETPSPPKQDLREQLEQDRENENEEVAGEDLADGQEASPAEKPEDEEEGSESVSIDLEPTDSTLNDADGTSKEAEEGRKEKQPLNTSLNGEDGLMAVTDTMMEPAASDISSAADIPVTPLEAVEVDLA